MWRLFRALFLLGAPLLAQPVTAQQAAPDQVLGAAFFDEFDSFDRNRWYVSDGWSNGTWMNCTWARAMVDLRDGLLSLGFEKRRAGERDYACGEIQTRQIFGYGTYEVKMRAPRGSGLNAAFFTYIGPVHGQPHDEIDVEILGRDTAKVDLNAYVGGKDKGKARVDVPADAADSFVHYAFVWEEARLRWYIDGVLVHELTPAEAPIPTHAQRIYLSLWGSDSFTDWMGPFVDPGQKVVAEYDWVAFTPLGSPCQFAASIACDLQE